VASLLLRCRCILLAPSHVLQKQLLLHCYQPLPAAVQVQHVQLDAVPGLLLDAVPGLLPHVAPAAAVSQLGPVWCGCWAAALSSTPQAADGQDTNLLLILLLLVLLLPVLLLLLLLQEPGQL
jgi:hypothetical protein